MRTSLFKYPLLALFALVALPCLAAPVSKPVAYQIGDQKFEGRLVYDDSVKTLRPGLLMAPNWLGPTPAAFRQAQEIAGKDYVIFVADMYGTSVRPKNNDEAGAATQPLYADRGLLRARVGKALAVLREQEKTAPVDPAKIGAIGFCFGGTSVLELARTGADLAGVVSFHGGLAMQGPAENKPIRAKILALHGANDPFVTADQVSAFENEMRTDNIDWQLVIFGGAVHGFTDPDANTPGQVQYNPRAAKRAFRYMHEFFAEIWPS
ncbi:MAG: dienelactone hydrolase family protein [Stenotrophobium sp.]